ncbi:MAG: hypothetical protein U1E50_09250 [Caulobacteraceae bacterium]
MRSVLAALALICAAPAAAQPYDNTLSTAEAQRLENERMMAEQAARQSAIQAQIQAEVDRQRRDTEDRLAALEASRRTTSQRLSVQP